jgi:hypothetical protein
VTGELNSEKPSLSRSQRLILAFHIALALVFVATGFFDTSGGDGFADLARLLLVLLAGIYLLAVATIAAISRYLVSGAALRSALLLLGPPVMMAIAIVAIRGV